jgi:hypothetical protein
VWPGLFRDQKERIQQQIEALHLWIVTTEPEEIATRASIPADPVVDRDTVRRHDGRGTDTEFTQPIGLIGEEEMESKCPIEMRAFE